LKFICRPSGTRSSGGRFPALKRRAIFGTSLRDGGLLAALVLFFAVGATAQTNVLSDAEIQGRQLAQQILEQRPATDFIQHGALKFTDAKKNHVEFFMECKIVSGPSDPWTSFYNLSITNVSRQISLVIHHYAKERNRYIYNSGSSSAKTNGLIIAVGAEGNTDSESKIRSVSLAGTDFWVTDLGLEFFHWPQQKVLPKSTNLKRGRDYTLLESTNPNPAPNGYSRVVSWIDKETGGILEAEAYDAQNQLLKVFEPKSFKKINGQWELQEMEIRNVQTGSRTRLEFDLKSN
jgi:hypothetical protein